MSTSIQKRGKRWTANIRLNGHSVSGTFDLKDQAKRWAEGTRRSILDAVADGTVFDPATVKIRRRKPGPPGDLLGAHREQTQDEIDADPAPRADWTLRRAMQHYDDTEVEKLSGARQVRARVRAWQSSSLSQKRLREITGADLAAWIAIRAKRRKTTLPNGEIRIDLVPVAASTMRNDVYRIGVLFQIANDPATKGGWELSLANPVTTVSLPTLPAGRQRRLDHGDGDAKGEAERMLAALATGPNPEAMLAFWVIAVGTGMRRSEILDLRAGEVRATPGGRVIERPTSKNGHPRRVILMERAANAVVELRKGKRPDERLFTLKAEQVSYRWRRARRLADCADLRLHDLRHEALSVMADAGLSIGALAQQSGHRTTQTLLRYVQARESEIRRQLKGHMD